MNVKKVGWWLFAGGGSLSALTLVMQKELYPIAQMSLGVQVGQVVGGLALLGGVVVLATKAMRR